MAKRQRTAAGFRPDPRVPGGYGAKNAFEAWAGRKYPSGQYVRQYHPRNAETLANFGRSRRTATPGQLAARDHHRVVGRGRYNLFKSVKRGFRSAGRGITRAASGFGKQMNYASGKALRAINSPTGRGVIERLAVGTARGALMGGPEGALAGLGTAGTSLMSDAIMSRKIKGSGMYASPGLKSNRSSGTKRSISGRGAYATEGLRGRGTYSGAASQPFRNSSDKIIHGNLHGTKVAQFGHSGHDFGGCTYENQEFYQYIYAPQANEAGVIPFSSLSVEVQPGMMTPMLEQIAKNFKFYQFVGCVFHFETLLDGSALQSATGQVGSIYMHAFADSKSADFVSSSEFEHQDYVNSALVTEGLTCGVECDPRMLKGLDNAGINKIRFNGVSTEEINEYDQGRVQIALDGLNPALAGQVIGKLRVSYKVELIKNQLITAIGRGGAADQYTRTDDSQPVTAAEQRFSLWGYTKNYPVNPMIAHPYNNLGTVIKSLLPAGDAYGDVTEMRLPANLDGFFKLSCRLSVVTASTDVQSGSSFLSSAVLGGEFVTNPDNSSPWGGAGLLTAGNVEVVPIIDEAKPYGAGIGASAAVGSYGGFKTGGLVTASYDSIAGDREWSHSGNVLQYDGAAVSGSLGKHYIVSAYNQFTVTADTTSGQNGPIEYTMTGIVETYIRVRPANAGKRNGIVMVSGMQVIPSIAHNVDIIDWRIERADDHSQFGSAYPGVKL